MKDSEVKDIHKAIKHTFPKEKFHIHYIGDTFHKILLPRCPSIFENKTKEKWNGIYAYKLMLEGMTEHQRSETFGFILSLALENME